MVVDAHSITPLALDQRFSLAVENEHHETPISPQEVCPELVIDSLDVSAIVWFLDVGFLLTNVYLFVQGVHQGHQELVRIMLLPTLKLLIHFPDGTLEAPRIYREQSTRLPHLAYRIRKRHDEISIVSHHIVWIHLIFVESVLIWRRIFSIYNAWDTSEEISDIR